MSFTSAELYEITGLNTDGIAGFEAQLSLGRLKREALWPEHLKGKRVDDFQQGSFLARMYLAMRRGYAVHRRRQRMVDFRSVGATSCLLPRGADRKREQLDCLRDVAKTFNKPKKEG